MTILDELDRRLAPIGWARAEPWDDDEYVTYARRPNDEISFELGLDVEPREWGLRLNPVVAVRHVEVARLSGLFLGLPAGACMTAATLADLVARAAPSRWDMSFADGVRGEEAAGQQVVADLVAQGEPFLASMPTLADMIARISTDSRRSQVDDGNLAIAYMLSGDDDGARQALGAMEAKAVERPLLARGQFDVFLRGFRDYFNLG
ncbi:hypothetical protein [Actinophytocola xanthii]|uniref:Uncharacterized protein n=1 Tax=Actinophytocola xanthii TaxID=1912961 RepID=A0A1Q8CNU6_9PSEU|nr:hypothetical protein [Actinophytocola xanthii]OLF16023.1 hypothetical protein BU204_19215 [Actinophytocola xanthii]